ncbi:transcription initiation factor TFIID subunit 1 [Tanacetum coccineum]
MTSANQPVRLDVDDDEIVVLDIADQSKDYCEDVIWFTKSTSLDSSLDDDYFPLDQQDLEYRIIYDKSWDPNWMDEKNHGYRIVWDPQQSIPKPKLLLDLQEEHMLFEVLDNKGGEHLQLHAGAMITTPSADSAGGHGVKDELFLCTKNFSGEMKPKKKDDLEQGKILNDRDEYCEAWAQKLPGENKSLRPPGAFKKKSDLSAMYCEERPLLLGNPGMGAGLCTYYQKVSGGDQSGPHLGSQSEAPPEEERSSLKAKVLKARRGPSSSIIPKKATPSTSLVSDRLATSDTETVNRSSVKIMEVEIFGLIVLRTIISFGKKMTEEQTLRENMVWSYYKEELVRREEQEKVAELRRFEEAIKRERLEEMQQREKKRRRNRI